ncbi:MAG: hypothetical protein ACRDQT_04240 [Gaiellaceae bacterium]
MIPKPFLGEGGGSRAWKSRSMRALRRWLRQRLARRLAVAMRDAFVPLG